MSTSSINFISRKYFRILLARNISNFASCDGDFISHLLSNREVIFRMTEYLKPVVEVHLKDLYIICSFYEYIILKFINNIMILI